MLLLLRNRLTVPLTTPLVLKKFLRGSNKPLPKTSVSLGKYQCPATIVAAPDPILQHGLRSVLHTSGVMDPSVPMSVMGMTLLLK